MMQKKTQTIFLFLNFWPFITLGPFLYTAQLQERSLLQSGQHGGQGPKQLFQSMTLLCTTLETKVIV
jgi:hypothetical protein